MLKIFDLKKFNERLIEPRYSGNFSISGFIESHAQLFIVLGVFCALTFYISTTIRSQAYTLLSFNNPLTLFINDPSDIFIQLSLCSSFFIVMILIWIILSEAVRYQDHKEIKYHVSDVIKSKDAMPLDAKNRARSNFGNAAANVMQRYFFIFVFYGLVFYDISYLIYEYMPNLKIIMIIGSLAIQIFLIDVVYDEIIKNNDTSMKAGSFEKYNQSIKVIPIIASIIVFLCFLYFQDNIFIRLFFLLPSLLFLALTFFGLCEVWDIILDCITYKGNSVQKSATSILAFIIVLALLASIAYTVTTSTNNDPIIGYWVTPDHKVGYQFNTDHTFRLTSEATNSSGYWGYINGTYYLTYTSVIAEYANRTSMIYDVTTNCLYAQDGSGFCIIKVS